MADHHLEACALHEAEAFQAYEALRAARWLDPEHSLSLDTHLRAAQIHATLHLAEQVKELVKSR